MNKLQAICTLCNIASVLHRPTGTKYCLKCGPKAGARHGGAQACAQVARAIKCGILPRVKSCACVDCGAQARDYDHRDYNKPLDVAPVCRVCNIRRGPAIARKQDQPLPTPTESAGA